METIRLRALSLDDLPKTLEWHNDEEISCWYSGHPFPVNEEMERQWYEKILTSNFPLSVFGIEHIEKQEMIGITVLKDINMINRSAELAIYIGHSEYRGKGLAEKATRLTLGFGFKKLGLNRIMLKVMEENTPAIKLYEKVGFIKEGSLRKSVYKNGKFQDELIFSLLIGEFNG